MNNINDFITKLVILIIINELCIIIYNHMYQCMHINIYTNN